MVSISKLELIIYLIIYLFFLFYGVWNVYLIRNDISNGNKLAKGWNIIGRPRDDYDDSMETFKSFLWKNVHWFIIHIVVSEIMRYKNSKFVPLIHAIIGFTYIIVTKKIKTQFLIISVISSFYIILKLSSTRKLTTWILFGIWTIVINFIIRNSNELTNIETFNEAFELLLILSWATLKCSSYNFSYINNQRNLNRNDNKLKTINNMEIDIYTIINYFGYTLYFPTFTFGPFMIFERYIKLIDNNKEDENNKNKTNIEYYYWENLTNRLIELIKNIFIGIFWMTFVDIMSHFIYVHYLEHDLHMVKHLNSFGLYGFGYLMGQFFQLYYTISYGIGIAIAKFDQLNPPSRPKCIGRINFYSTMWKYFDQGLYEYLFIYIYSTLCSKSSSVIRKSLSSIVTFSFIFIWHGWFLYIFVWTFFNYICLVMEKFFKYLTSTKQYKNFIELWLSSINQERLYGFLGVHVFIPSALSNIYFFAGIDIGNYFILSTYTNGCLHYLCLTLASYCMFQCSQVINNFDNKNIIIKN